MPAPITLTVTIRAAEAVTRGLDAQGDIALPVTPSAMTEPQRALLARLLPGPVWTGGIFAGITLPPVPISADQVAAWLDTTNAALSAHADAQREKAEAATQQLLSLPPEKWRGHSGQVRAGDRVFSTPIVNAPTVDSALNDDPRVIARRAEIERDHLPAWLAQHEREVAAGREEHAKREAEAEAKAKALAAATRQREAQIAAWLAEHGTDAQRKRAARDLLPEAEVLAAMRDAAFAPLVELPRYRRLTDDDVRDGLDLHDGQAVEYTTRDSEAVSDATMALIERIETAMPGCTVEPLDHVGYAADASGRDDPELVRQALRVTMTVGAITMSREYAV